MGDYAFVINIIALVIYTTFTFWHVLNTMISNQLVAHLLYRRILDYTDIPPILKYLIFGPSLCNMLPNMLSLFVSF